MMDIMKSRILLISPLQWVPRYFISAMVIDAFQHRNGAETHCLADCETGEHEGEGCADGVEEEGFREGIVEGAEGVGNVDLVVVRVHVACFILSYVSKIFLASNGSVGRRGMERTKHPFVGMHSSVPEILPSVTEHDGDSKPCCRF